MSHSAVDVRSAQILKMESTYALGSLPCEGVTSILMVSFRFFFQAEAGIRDLTVTGVQTCALPISLCRGSASAWPWPTPGPSTPTCWRPLGATARYER